MLITAHRRAAAGQPLTRLHHWALTLRERRGHNKATIAMANKLGRIVWAVWHNDVPYAHCPTPPNPNAIPFPLRCSASDVTHGPSVDRHRIRPIAALALEAGTTIGPRCATIHDGQEDKRLHRQAGYTTAADSKDPGRDALA